MPPFLAFGQGFPLFLTSTLFPINIYTILIISYFRNKFGVWGDAKRTVPVLRASWLLTNPVVNTRK